MSTIVGTTLNADTIRKTGGSLGTDIRIKNTSVYESDGGTSVTQNLVQGVAKVWNNVKQTGTQSIQDSFNVGSYTDVATGVHAPNFTNNFATAEGYGHAGTHGANEDVTNMNYTQQCHNRNDVDTGSCEIVSVFGHTTSQGVYDYHYVTNQFVGDLA